MPFGMTDDEIQAFIDIYKLKPDPRQEYHNSKRHPTPLGSSVLCSSRGTESTRCALKQVSADATAISTQRPVKDHQSLSSTTTATTTIPRNEAGRRLVLMDEFEKDVKDITPTTPTRSSRLWRASKFNKRWTTKA